MKKLPEITCTSTECPERRSVCCKAKPEAVSGNEGTGYYRCKACKNEFISPPCTARDIPFKEGIDFVQISPCREFEEKIKDLPDEFPDIESDMFDKGYQQCKVDILKLINNMINEV